MEAVEAEEQRWRQQAGASSPVARPVEVVWVTKDTELYPDTGGTGSRHSMSGPVRSSAQLAASGPGNTALPLGTKLLPPGGSSASGVNAAALHVSGLPPSLPGTV